MTEIGLACDHARFACNSIKGRHDLFLNVYDELIRDKLRKQQFHLIHKLDMFVVERVCKDYSSVIFNFLKKADCEKVQGYFFGKPMPMEDSRNFTMSKGLKWEKRNND